MLKWEITHVGLEGQRVILISTLALRIIIPVNLVQKF